MEYMMAAWRQSPFEFHGRYYSTPEPLTVLPRPVQQPHPEVYVACFSKPSIELAARLRVNTIFAPFAAAMLFGSVQEAARESKRMAREAGHPRPEGVVQSLPLGLAQPRGAGWAPRAAPSLPAQHPAGAPERPPHRPAARRVLRRHRRAAASDEAGSAGRPEHRHRRRQTLHRGPEGVRGGGHLRGDPVLQLRRALSPRQPRSEGP